MCLQIKTLFSKTRGHIIFLGDFGPRYVHHFQHTFRPAMNKAKVKFSMAIYIKLAKSFSMGLSGSIVIAQFQ